MILSFCSDSIPFVDIFVVKFHRQLLIDTFTVDFYCYELILAIEIDGNSHLNTDVQINDDMRQKTIEELSVTFLKFNYLDKKRI